MDGVLAESGGFSVFLLNSPMGGNDTLQFDSITFNAYNVNNYIVRLDSNGKVVKAISIANYGRTLCGDGNGNFYLGGGNIIAKLDKNFNQLWTKQIPNIGSSGNRFKFSNGHLYNCSATADSTKLIEINTSDRSTIWIKNICKNKYQSKLALSDIINFKNK